MREVWDYKKLGDLCKTGAGGTPLKSKKKNYENGTIPWLRSGEVNNRNIINCEIRITETGLNNSSAKLFPPRTVLIAMYGATAGQVGILNFECSTNQAVCGILPNESFVPEFLYYFFLKFKEELIAQAVGGAQPNISQQKIKNTLIPNISLEEQQQIVALLDEAFEAIDQAKANIEKNIENAKELFQSKLNEIFSQKGDGWEEKQIKDLTSLVTKGSSPKWQGVNYVDGGGIFFLTSKNVGEGELLLNNKKYLEEKFNEIQKASVLTKGDVLTNIVGASIGRTAVFDLDEITNINQAVCLMRCDAEKVFSYYLMYLLNSPFFKKILHDNEVDNARANLSLTFFKNLSIPLPKLVEQKEIVENIKLFSSEIKKLESHYQQKLNDLEELKKSILQKAFAGELTNKTVEI